AAKNGLTVIVASTNLVLRDLYEAARADKQIEKLLLVDRCPARRRNTIGEQAPAPLYPDLVAEVGEQGIIDLDLREYLIDETKDSAWPQKIKDGTYSRLVAKNLQGVIRAHKNLRVADPSRFTDHDLATIVAYAAMGVPDSAFKHNDPESLWRIGLIASTRFGELETIAPDIVETVRSQLQSAPAPYCWLAKHDPETVLRAFYTAVILQQHSPDWKLLLPNLDPGLQPYKDMDPKVLQTAPADLISLSEERAHADLAQAEAALTRDGLQLVFVDRLGGDKPEGFAGILERERYSTLFRELALFLALRDQLSTFPAVEHHARIRKGLLEATPTQASDSPFVERRPSAGWAGLKEAYDLAGQFAVLRKDLAAFVKALGVRKTEHLDFKYFWEQWNGKRLNRSEYFLSAIERAVGTNALLPRSEDQLPAVFANALDELRQRVNALTSELNKQLDEVNRRFQEMVAAQYKTWIHGETNVHLTCQFVPRVLKPNWDPQTEDAVVLVFDGMRYDIFDELLKPAIADRLELVKEYHGSSVLPSETEVSRWAIAAGQPPDTWWADARKPENFHLKTALDREFGFKGDAEAYAPPGSGTGETVRYRAGRLQYIIFEFCDKELHKITSKTLADGRQVPSRPLALIYRQLLKDLIDNEVMAVVRQLPAGMKVFITADHGFGRVARDRLQVDHAWLNQPEDCLHLNAWLRKT
ncbi:MAG: PglZ domain-containing protein, partial [Phycisphaerales bacterium]|nr:PglZ domain-containing protein [Phycisphaerales bacterium]